MSISSEHRRMEPVLEAARKLDIACNPDPAAIFEAGSAGFQIWCIPDDHPEGWGGIHMDAGAFSKPCEFVGSVYWQWHGEEITGLVLETTAYALADQKPREYRGYTEGRIHEGDARRSITNREADIEWLKAKVAWLFEQAGVPLPALVYGAQEAAPAANHEDGWLEAGYEERTDAQDE